MAVLVTTAANDGLLIGGWWLVRLLRRTPLWPRIGWWLWWRRPSHADQTDSESASASISSDRLSWRDERYAWKPPVAESSLGEHTVVGRLQFLAAQYQQDADRHSDEDRNQTGDGQR